MDSAIVGRSAVADAYDDGLPVAANNRPVGKMYGTPIVPAAAKPAFLIKFRLFIILVLV